MPSFRCAQTAILRASPLICPQDGRFHAVLALGQADVVWNCTASGPRTVVETPSSARKDLAGLAVVSLQTFVGAATDSHALQRAAFPPRCSVLCLLSYAGVTLPTTSSARVRIAMTALVLCFNPLGLVVVVRGTPLRDNWSKAFWRHCDSMFGPSADVNRFPLVEDMCGLELCFARSPSLISPFVFGKFGFPTFILFGVIHLSPLSLCSTRFGSFAHHRTNCSICASVQHWVIGVSSCKAACAKWA